MIDYPVASALNASWLGASVYSPPIGTAISVAFAEQYYPSDRATWPVAELLPTTWVGASVYSPPTGTSIAVAWEAISHAGGVRVNVPARNIILTFFPGAATQLGWDGLVPELQIGVQPQVPEPTLTYNLYVPQLWSQLGCYAPVVGSVFSFDKAPTAIWPGYSSDGTSITIPIGNIPYLTVANADTVTGDWQEIVVGLLRSPLAYTALFDLYDPIETVQIKERLVYVGERAPYGYVHHNRISYTFVVDQICYDVRPE